MSSWLHAHRHTLAALPRYDAFDAVRRACYAALVDPRQPHALTALDDGVFQALNAPAYDPHTTYPAMRALAQERFPLLHEAFGLEGQMMYYYASTAASLHQPWDKTPWSHPAEALKSLEMVVFRSGHRIHGPRWREVDALVAAALEHEIEQRYL